jgi:hypothetical protein
MKSIYASRHYHPSDFSKIKGGAHISLEVEKTDLQILETGLQTFYLVFL